MNPLTRLINKEAGSGGWIFYFPVSSLESQCHFSRPGET